MTRLRASTEDGVIYDCMTTSVKAVALLAMPHPTSHGPLDGAYVPSIRI